MYIQWIEEKHSLEIPSIDSQHKQLFLIVNQMEELKDGPDYPRRLQELLKRLYAYTKFHFTSEEGIFRYFNYPAGESHRIMHNTFTGHVKGYLDFYRHKPHASLDEPKDYLVSWIINHIQGEDYKYKLWFNEKQIDPVVYFSHRESQSHEQLQNDALDLWSRQKLALDIESIDSQHKELIMILQQANDLGYANETRKRAFLPNIIQRLFYYSQYHFSFEEELMAKNNYNELKDHQESHKEYISRVREFAREYKNNVSTLNDEIVVFLKDWVINHILKEDGHFRESAYKA